MKSPAQQEWEKKYVAHFVEAGLDIDSAVAVCEAGDHDYNTDPTEAANDEMSYWDNDGDET